jgi:hypothetical protein
MKNVTRLRERKGATRRGAPIWLAAALLLLGFNGCEWDERLPFNGNELDPALLGFWLEVPSNPKEWRIADSVGVYKLSQFKRDGDDYHRVLLECPFEAFGRVVRVVQEPVFTKKGFFYRIGTGDLFTYYLDAQPYSIHGDTLTLRSRWSGWEHYVRVSDTSTVDWATRRAMRKRKG